MHLTSTTPEETNLLVLAVKYAKANYNLVHYIHEESLPALGEAYDIAQNNLLEAARNLK